MRVFVAGATGAIGSPLVTSLIRRGHTVIGTTRYVERARTLEAAGTTPTLMDALDPISVKDAVAEAEPDLIVHELTAIPPEANLRRFEQAFAQTNRLRTEGTDHLIAATEAVAVRRFVTQSFAAWPYARRGSWVKTEDDPLDDDPPAQVRRTVDAAGGDRARGGTGRTGRLQRHGRRAGGGAGLASCVRRRDRRLAPASRSRMARPPVRRRAQRDDDDRTAWGLEREGQARAGVGAQVPLVESGVPRRPRLSARMEPAA